MVKKSAKTKKETQKYDPRPVLCHPLTWISAILALALLIIYGVSMYGFKTLGAKTQLEHAELKTFSHLAESYIEDMDFTYGFDNQPVIKYATGYGVSSEDGVLYITFDFAPVPSEGARITSYKDLDLHHAILYFQDDKEHGSYGHAFGYYDDPSYHPDGTYVELKK